jgi:hypothetical protein
MRSPRTLNTGKFLQVRGQAWATCVSGRTDLCVRQQRVIVQLAPLDDAGTKCSRYPALLGCKRLALRRNRPHPPVGLTKAHFTCAYLPSTPSPVRGVPGCRAPARRVAAGSPSARRLQRCWRNHLTGTPSVSGAKNKAHAWRAVLFARRSKGQSNTGDSTPNTLCSLGLVVVYWRNTFLSGEMMGMAPKAASAHSWKPERISFFLPG